VRHSYFTRDEGSDAFTDLLFNALLGFAFMFVTAFSLISDPNDRGKVDPNAEVLITVRWPDDHPDDIDTIVEDPRGELVWYHNKDSGLMHLDRDDRGTFQDTLILDGQTVVSPINQETVSLRAVTPGEYIVNLLHYKANFKGPVPVTVKVEKLNPNVILAYYGTHELTGIGHELTAVRFRIDADGNLNDFSSRQKPLVVKAVKR
jgi:hypothetical protein